ncbi:efflux RND transporter periplasmic adaptor subunit [Epilithonimonas hominis]|uniref:efflux RND transporter periplasmic adaptor subunit n=1 Tax=Epilithonimonas hominis TaxID=420404 RepID=UPI0028A257EF|nr:efflux RND transporter periplasmic adaptor subunit [Epilithonimonas hominis]
MKNLLQCLFLFALFYACKDTKNNRNKDQNLFVVKGETVQITEHNPVLGKIITETIKEESHSNMIISAGTIQAIPNHYAEVASPFSGRITNSYIKLGQRVNAGSPIFEILSSDYFSVQKDYNDAVNDVQLAQKNYHRQKDLVKHGVGIQKELEEAETDYKNKKNALNNASSALKVYNNKTMGLGSPLIVRSPISGEVISNRIVNGQFLRNDSEAVVIIAELSKVWIAGEVKEKDIRFINKGDQVSVKVNAYPDQEITGKVYHIDDVVDEATRSLKVLIECDNPSRKLKPGMYANINYSVPAESAIIIPVSAVMQKDSSQFVWLKSGNNQYTRRKIITGDSIDKTVKIISGLQDGDVIISQGGIYLQDAR